METQYQNASVLSAIKTVALQACQFKSKTPISTFRGSSNMPSYNQVLVKDGQTAARFAHLTAQRYVD